MTTVDKIRLALADRNLAQVSRQTGLHHNTLIKIRSGVSAPHIATIKLLVEYLGLGDE